MARSFQEENPSSACNPAAFCSPGTTATGSRKQCRVGGIPGTTNVTVTAPANTTDRILQQFQLENINLTSWDAGDYVVRLNVVTANSLITWVSTYLCRINSSCVSQETVGSLTGQSISLGSTGVKTMTISGSAVAAALSDDLMIVLLFDSGGSHGNNSAGFKSDQIIDTPLAALPRRIFIS